MVAKHITRRVFMGTTAYLISAPLLASLPASQSSNQLVKIVDSGMFFSAEELSALTDIAELMIPKTDTPGATDANVVTVIDAMMNTWASSDTKARFKALIKQIDTLANGSFNSSYLKTDIKDRESLLVSLDQRAFADRTTEISVSYRKLKELVFHVFYTSQEANPNYVLIPGTYKGCVSEVDYQKMVDKRLGRA